MPQPEPARTTAYLPRGTERPRAEAVRASSARIALAQRPGCGTNAAI
jgi:hypothetical protein